jgi:transposase
VDVAGKGCSPRKTPAGDRAVLQGISKCGDRYLRTLLIHGARIALHHSSRKVDPSSRWVNTIKQRRGYNVATVALANKNARVL